MSLFQPLPQQEEDELHAKRLLNIEEKPFKRIQKRLLAPNNPIQEFLRRTAATTATTSSHSHAKSSENGAAEIQSDPEDGSTHTVAEAEAATTLKSLQAFHTATLHDFSALTTSLARLQFLLDANVRERERYVKQADTITAQHAAIREDTARLRVRLSEAREQLEVRKGYDKLADRVLYVQDTSPAAAGSGASKERVKAKTREELGRESEKLRNEIEELEREGVELSQQWRDRRDVLGDVMLEAARLRRVVRAEPEPEPEVERDPDDGESEADGDGDGEEGEGEKRREDDEDGTLGAAEADRESASHVGTPRPLDDGGSTPFPHGSVHGQHDSGVMTPLHPGVDESGGMTPRSVENDGGMTPRPLTADGRSALRNEMHFGEDDGDVERQHGQHQHHDHHDHERDLGHVGDVPELRVDDAEKAELAEMDMS